MASVQPSGMMNDNGAVLTVGIQTSGEQTAIVLPIATETVMDPGDLCTRAVQDFVTGVLPALLDCLSSDAYVRFIQAEGMVDGKVPSRLDFTASDHPGTGAANTAPPQVAALIACYEDPADATPGARMRVGKTFLPGISTAMITEGNINGPEITLLLILTGELLGGWTNSVSGGGHWYRVLATPFTPGPPRTRPGGVGLKRCLTIVPRGYTATQRRRLLPH